MSQRKAFSNLCRRQQYRRLKLNIEEELSASSESNCSTDIAICNVLGTSNESVVDTESSSEVGIANNSSSNDLNISEISNSQERSLVSDINSDGNISSNASTNDFSIQSRTIEQSSEQSMFAINERLRKSISLWAQNERRVPNESVTRLLKIMNNFGEFELPNSARGLLQYKQISLQIMETGEYYHFDWISSITKFLENIEFKATEINIIANIDGIPLFSSSRRYEAYPILLKVKELNSKVFTAGIYCTNHTKKELPKVDTLLEQFIEDIQNFKEIEVNGITVKLTLLVFSCDAPMRSYIKGTVNHCSYNSCERCVQHGKYDTGAKHVTLLKLKSVKRTDSSFLNRDDISHHKVQEKTLLETRLNFNMVTGFALDYMHLCCLGVMKRLLQRLIKSKVNQVKRHMNTRQKTIFDENLTMIRLYIPSDFPRKFEGGVKHLPRWKASEFRLLMLYVGFVLLKCTPLYEGIYKHFLFFAIAMRILLSDNNNTDLAKELVKRFVKEAKKIYGKGFISYNVHSLIHLPDDYKKYGNLEHISCYNFESYLGTHIKGAVRSGFKPLNQIITHVNNVNDKIESNETFPLFVRKHHHNSCKIYLNRNSKIVPGSLGNRDNVVQLTDGSLAIVTDIQSMEDIEVQCFDKVNSFFKDPLDSKLVGIFRVSKLQAAKRIPFQLIAAKMMLLPYKSSYIALSLLHSNIS